MVLVPAPVQCCLGNHPLQDAGVFPAGGDQVSVVVQEGHVGHMTAVTAVLVTRSLKNTEINESGESDDFILFKVLKYFYLRDS